jgi:hypothetical protein
VLLILSVVMTGFGFGQTAPNFSPGEQLHYSAWFNFVKGGESTLRIAGMDTINHQPVFHVQSTTESLPFFDRFYKVRDHMESWIDRQGLYSHRFSKSIREGKYRKKYAVDFDYQQNLAISKTDSHTVPANVHDGLSMFYYVRALDLTIGDIIKINYFDNDSLMLFLIRVDQIETVKAPIGDVDCYVLAPYLESGKRLKHKSKITIYISTDHRRLPVMISNSARFGTLTLKLESIQ